MRSPMNPRRPSLPADAKPLTQNPAPDHLEVVRRFSFCALPRFASNIAA